jgi:LPXTG-site transpeptidase (sortase) family protein
MSAARLNSKKKKDQPRLVFFGYSMIVPSLPKSVHIALPIVLVLILLLGANASYIRAHAAYYLNPPQPQDTRGISLPHIDAPPVDTPNIVRIPSLGIEAPLQFVTTVSEETFQLALRDGVVLFPGTALPGKPGNTYIFGHSSDYSWSKGQYKTVFALLPKIKEGADIIVTNASGTSFTYRVSGTSIVGPKDTHVLDQQNYTRYLLTLQTSYPLGTALKRFLVHAELTTSTRAE